jgi:transposase-like protein
MKPAVKKPSHSVDWDAVRLAYETGDKPISRIARQHGTTKSAMAHRRQRDNWQMRRDRVRILRPHKDALEKPAVDWDAVQREYEEGEYTLREIYARHGINQSNLYRHKNERGWRPRCSAFPKAFGAGGTTNAMERLKILAHREIDMVEARLGLDEKIDTGDALRALHAMASIMQKMLDIEHREKLRDAGDHTLLVIDDASRLELARRLEALADTWEHERGAQAH